MAEPMKMKVTWLMANINKAISKIDRMPFLITNVFTYVIINKELL
jgi:hypothetical protein